MAGKILSSSEEQKDVSLLQNCDVTSVFYENGLLEDNLEPFAMSSPSTSTSRSKILPEKKAVDLKPKSVKKSPNAKKNVPTNVSLSPEVVSSEEPRLFATVENKTENANSKKDVMKRCIPKKSQKGTSCNLIVKSIPNASQGSVSVNLESENDKSPKNWDTKSANSTELQNKYYYYFPMNRSRLNMVKGEKPYQCHVCDNLYKYIFSLKRHFLRIHITECYISEADLSNCKIADNGKRVEKKKDSVSPPSRKRMKLSEGNVLDNNKEGLMPGLYKCSFHEVKYDRESELRDHHSSVFHPKKEEFFCKLCKAVFDSKGKLNDHLKNCPPNPVNLPNYCKKCKVSYQSQEEYEYHLTIHDNGKFCKYCNKEFSNVANRKRHENLHEGSQSFKCKHCDFSSQAKKDLNIHIRKAHMDMYLKCDKCPKFGIARIFASKAALQSHILECHGDKKEVILKNGSVTKTNKPKKIAKKTTGLKTISKKSQPSASICNFCKKTFPDVRAMLRHKNIAHKKRTTYKRKVKKTIIAKAIPKKPAKKKSIIKKPTKKEKEEEEQRFYSNVPYNVAENYLHYVDGKEDQLSLKKVECLINPTFPDFDSFNTDFSRSGSSDVERNLPYNCRFTFPENQLDRANSNFSEIFTATGLNKISVCAFQSNQYELKCPCNVCLHSARKANKKSLKERLEMIDKKPMIYVCNICKEHFSSYVIFEAHCDNNHPFTDMRSNVIAIEGEKDKPFVLPPHLFHEENVNPNGILSEHSEPNSEAQDLSRLPECTKCHAIVSWSLFHEHIIMCAGEDYYIKKHIRKCIPQRKIRNTMKRRIDLNIEQKPSEESDEDNKMFKNDRVQKAKLKCDKNYFNIKNNKIVKKGIPIAKETIPPCSSCNRKFSSQAQLKNHQCSADKLKKGRKSNLFKVNGLPPVTLNNDNIHNRSSSSPKKKLPSSNEITEVSFTSVVENNQQDSQSCKTNNFDNSDSIHVIETVNNSAIDLSFNKNVDESSHSDNVKCTSIPKESEGAANKSIIEYLKETVNKIGLQGENNINGKTINSKDDPCLEKNAEPVKKNEPCLKRNAEPTKKNELCLKRNAEPTKKTEPCLKRNAEPTKKNEPCLKRNAESTKKNEPSLKKNTEPTKKNEQIVDIKLKTTSKCDIPKNNNMLIKKNKKSLDEALKKITPLSKTSQIDQSPSKCFVKSSDLKSSPVGSEQNNNSEKSCNSDDLLDLAAITIVHKTDNHHSDDIIPTASKRSRKKQTPLKIIHSKADKSVPNRLDINPSLKETINNKIKGLSQSFTKHLNALDITDNVISSAELCNNEKSKNQPLDKPPVVSDKNCLPLTTSIESSPLSLNNFSNDVVSDASLKTTTNLNSVPHNTVTEINSKAVTETNDSLNNQIKIESKAFPDSVVVSNSFKTDDLMPFQTPIFTCSTNITNSFQPIKATENKSESLPVLQAPVLFLSNEGLSSELASSQDRDSPTLEVLVSSVTQNLEDFDEHSCLDDVKFSLPDSNSENRLLSRETEVKSKISINRPMNFTIIIPESEKLNVSNHQHSLSFPVDTKKSTPNTFKEFSMASNFLPLNKSSFGNIDPKLTLNYTNNMGLKNKETSTTESDSVISKAASMLKSCEANTSGNITTAPFDGFSPFQSVPLKDMNNSNTAVHGKNNLVKSACVGRKEVSTNNENTRTIQEKLKNSNQNVHAFLEDLTLFNIPNTDRIINVDIPAKKLTDLPSASEEVPSKEAEEIKVFEDPSCNTCPENSTVMNSTTKLKDVSKQSLPKTPALKRKTSVIKKGKKDNKNVSNFNKLSFGSSKSEEAVSSAVSHLRAFRRDNSEAAVDLPHSETSKINLSVFERTDSAAMANMCENNLLPDNLSNNMTGKELVVPSNSKNEATESAEGNTIVVKKEAEGAKKHSCPYCMLEFAYLTNFRRHMKQCQDKSELRKSETPSTSSSHLLQHLPKKEEVEESMLNLLRHQKRQNEIIQDGEIRDDAEANKGKKLQAYNCHLCHRIFLKFFEKVKHLTNVHFLSNGDSKVDINNQNNSQNKEINEEENSSGKDIIEGKHKPMHSSENGFPQISKQMEDEKIPLTVVDNSSDVQVPQQLSEEQSESQRQHTAPVLLKETVNKITSSKDMTSRLKSRKSDQEPLFYELPKFGQGRGKKKVKPNVTNTSEIKTEDKSMPENLKEIPANDLPSETVNQLTLTKTEDSQVPEKPSPKKILVSKLKDTISHKMKLLTSKSLNVLKTPPLSTEIKESNVKTDIKSKGCKDHKNIVNSIFHFGKETTYVSKTERVHTYNKPVLISNVLEENKNASSTQLIVKRGKGRKSTTAFDAKPLKKKKKLENETLSSPETLTSPKSNPPSSESPKRSKVLKSKISATESDELISPSETFKSRKFSRNKSNNNKNDIPKVHSKTEKSVTFDSDTNSSLPSTSTAVHNKVKRLRRSKSSSYCDGESGSLFSRSIIVDNHSDSDDFVTSPPNKHSNPRRKVLHKICPLCKKKFTSSLERNRHVQLVHSRNSLENDIRSPTEISDKKVKKLNDTIISRSSFQRQCAKPLPPMKRKYVRNSPKEN